MNSLQEGFEVPPLSKAAIRAYAANARSVLQLGPGRISIERLLDRLSAGYGIHYDVVDDMLANGIEACFVPEQNTLYIAGSIHREMAVGGQRAMFTLGHEMGHVVLAHRRTLNRRSDSGVPPKIFRNSEWQANRFAAEFTMPLEGINAGGLFTEWQLIQRFGVSSVAARVRLEDLKKEGVLKGKAPEARQRF